METSDAQDWCDFCKEPFRKKSEAAKAAEQPSSKPAQESLKPSTEAQKPPAKESPKPSDKDSEVAITPELLAKLQLHQTRSESVDPTRGEIPSEFLHLDAGERIPTVSPAVRKTAWVFLTIVFIWIIVFTAIILSKGDPSANKGAKVKIVN